MKLKAIFCLLLVEFAFTSVGSVALNFVNKSSSVAIFEPWFASRTGMIKFNFKTFDPDGLLFYVGDNDDPEKAGNYMYLKLEWGKAILVTQVHYFSNMHEENKIEERIALGSDLNDGNWHGIVVERKGHYTTLTVDKESSTLQLADKIADIYITSNLYVGGIQESFLFDGCQSIQNEFARFLGCIKDLVYGEGSFIDPKKMIASEFVHQKEVCLDACKPGPKCLNEGICKNRFVTYECDCLGTGFDGKRCDRRAETITMDGLGYIEAINKTISNNTEISVTFRTKATSGIIFAVGDQSSFLVIQLVGDKVKVSSKLRTGYTQSITVDSQHVVESRWHTIRVTRRKQEVRVKLDERKEISKTLIANDDNDAIIDSVYVGGAWNINKVFPGFTQTRFCGCLRQVYYNKIDILKYSRPSGAKINECRYHHCRKK